MITFPQSLHSFSVLFLYSSWQDSQNTFQENTIFPPQDNISFLLYLAIAMKVRGANDHFSTLAAQRRSSKFPLLAGVGHLSVEG